MSANSFGTLFRFTTWGESHGPAIGCVVDGAPPRGREQPAHRVGRRTMARPGDERLRHRLLRDVLGLRRVAEHPQRDPEDPVLVGDHQLLKGLRVATPEPIEESRRVPDLRLTHGDPDTRPEPTPRTRLSQESMAIPQCR